MSCFRQSLLSRTMWPACSALPGECRSSNKCSVRRRDGCDILAIDCRTLFPARLKCARFSLLVINFRHRLRNRTRVQRWPAGLAALRSRSKIIADMNGRCAGGTISLLQSGVTSATFEFDLARVRCPDLLVELQSRRRQIRSSVDFSRSWRNNQRQ